MKKKMLIPLCLFAVVFTAAGSAKSLGLNLYVGGVYTNHQIHDVWDSAYDGFNYRNIRSKHMGGFNIGLSYELPKNWAIFGSTIFSFNRIYVNDTQFGFGYTFKPGKGFSLFLGGAFAIGGSQFIGNGAAEEGYTNIGGRLNLTAFYMFTGQLGIYLGFSDNIYKPVRGFYKNTLRKKLPDMANSINLALGFKIRF